MPASECHDFKGKFEIAQSYQCDRQNFPRSCKLAKAMNLDE